MSLMWGAEPGPPAQSRKWARPGEKTRATTMLRWAGGIGAALVVATAIYVIADPNLGGAHGSTSHPSGAHSSGAAAVAGAPASGAEATHTAGQVGDVTTPGSDPTGHPGVGSVILGGGVTDPSQGAAGSTGTGSTGSTSAGTTAPSTGAATGSPSSAPTSGSASQSSSPSTTPSAPSSTPSSPSSSSSNPGLLPTLPPLPSLPIPTCLPHITC